MTTATDPVAQLVAALTVISLPPSDLDQLASQLRREPARLSLIDLGLDSLGRLEACIALELEHGVLITPESVAPLQDAEQLLRLITAAARV
jgi:acyl carrier protein